MGNRIVKEFGMDMYILLYLKWTYYSYIPHGTLLNVMWQPGWEFEGKWIHVYVWLSPFAVHLKLSHHFSPAIYKKVKKKTVESQ